MSDNSPKYYLVIDLEATTSDDGSLPREEMETIEIGAVLVHAESLEIESEFQSFVAPIRHPLLKPFCTELTGITQEMIEGAPLFPEAMQSLHDEMIEDRSGVIWGSWGFFDDKQLRKDSAFHDLEYNMPHHINLKADFSSSQNRRKRYGMAKALQLCGLKLDGAHHRALDDTRNIVKLLPWIIGMNKINS